MYSLSLSFCLCVCISNVVFLYPASLLLSSSIWCDDHHRHWTDLSMTTANTFCLATTIIHCLLCCSRIDRHIVIDLLSSWFLVHFRLHLLFTTLTCLLKKSYLVCSHHSSRLFVWARQRTQKSTTKKYLVSSTNTIIHTFRTHTN